MDLEIVSHCWHYSRLLTYQLSSLLLHPPQETRVLMTVCYTEEDVETALVLQYFAGLPLAPGITIRGWSLQRERLLRRAIGRNLAALATRADWVWFADCDYVFGEGALDHLGKCVDGVDARLVFPRTVMVNRTHALGDQAIAAASGHPRVCAVNVFDFEPHIQRRAIGGIQITRGDVARERGYLRNSLIHEQRPATWQRCREDSWFRKDLRTQGVPLDLPNVFRIRHSCCGRRDAELRL